MTCSGGGIHTLAFLTMDTIDRRTNRNLKAARVGNTMTKQYYIVYLSSSHCPVFLSSASELNFAGHHVTTADREGGRQRQAYGNLYFDSLSAALSLTPTLAPCPFVPRTPPQHSLPLPVVAVCRPALFCLNGHNPLHLVYVTQGDKT